MSKQPTIWFVVADGAHARVFSRDDAGIHRSRPGLGRRPP